MYSISWCYIECTKWRYVSGTRVGVADTPFSAAQIGHSDLAKFADESVNLKRDDAKQYREQVGRLREKLDKYAGDHPEHGLIATVPMIDIDAYARWISEEDRQDGTVPRVTPATA